MPAPQTPPTPPTPDEYGIDELIDAAQNPPAEPAPRHADKDPATGRFVKRHSPLVVSMAEELGLTRAEIDDSEPAGLEATVKHLYRQKRQYESQRPEPKSADRALLAPPEPGPAAPDDFALRVKSVSEDPENGLHDDLVGELKRLAEQNRQLHARLARLEGHVQGQVAESNAQKIDREILSLGIGHLLGDGPIDALAADAPAKARRQAIFAQAVRLAGDQATLPKILGHIKPAAALLYDVKAAPAKGDEPAPEHRRWLEAGLVPPTQREPRPDPKGPKSAERAVAQFQRDTAATNGVQALEDEFPS